MSKDLASLVRLKYREACEEFNSARLCKIQENVGIAPCPSRTARASRELASLVRADSSASINARKRPRSDDGRPPCDGTGVRLVPLTECTPPPTGLAWVRIRSNLRAPEGCEAGYFVPYLGESDELIRSSQSLAIDLVESTAHNGCSGGIDDDDENDLSDVEYATPQDYSLRGRRVWKFAWERATKRRTIYSLVHLSNLQLSECADALADVFGVSVDTVLAYYNNVTYRLKSWAQFDREKQFKEKMRQELNSAVETGLSEDPAEIIASDSLTMLLCRQCYTFDCMQHGIDPCGPKLALPDGTRADTMQSGNRQNIHKKCGSAVGGACWYQNVIESSAPNARESVKDKQLHNVLCPDAESRFDSDAIESSWQPLSSTAKVLFAELRKHMGDDFCRISEMIRIVDKHSVNLRCMDVGKHAQSAPPLPRPKQPRAIVKKPRLAVPAAEINGMMGGRRLDYSPCNHEGPCTSKVCQCAQMGVNCEKYCSCNHVRVSGDRTHSLGKCPRLFRGCNCKSSQACLTNLCVCFSTRRECDPDLCRSCGAGDAPFSRRACCNVGLRLGMRYRTIAGRSMVHGWGVFAAEQIPKNVLIGEYLGEVITQDEAERRGRVYDELNYSFLFNITESCVIDSTRLGSKLKYCNHSKSPNCEPRLMRVGGDVRVGIYSKRRIGLFEELLFDYGYHNGPAWAMTGKVSANNNAEIGSGTARKQSTTKRKRSVMKSALPNNGRADNVSNSLKTRGERSLLRLSSDERSLAGSAYHVEPGDDVISKQDSSLGGSQASEKDLVQHVDDDDDDDDANNADDNNDDREIVFISDDSDDD